MTDQTYKNCVLVSKQELGEFRVHIRPTGESKIAPMTTMLFQSEETAFAEARKYVDAHSK